MKGKVCSWRDMRRIKHILANGTRLKGELAALTACAGRTTKYDWDKAIQVMDSCRLSDSEHVQPTHAREIARHAPKAEWPQWVDRCESEHWTVSELRGQLLSINQVRAHEEAAVSAPEGKYNTIVVDPPWSYQNKSGRHAPDYNKKNRVMDLEQVKAFDISRWVPEEACHLYLWVTDAYLGHVYEVIESWGFVPKASLIWVKDRFGMGNYFRHQHETCIFALRGKLRLLRMNASTVFSAPITRHSEKPDQFYSLVESCSPGRYLDVFARKRRAGWDVFGDEVTQEYQTRLHGQQDSVHINA